MANVLQESCVGSCCQRQFRYGNFYGILIKSIFPINLFLPQLNDMELLTWDSNSSDNMMMMVDEDYMGLMSDTLFSTITNQPFAFPDSREIGNTLQTYFNLNEYTKRLYK